MHKGPSAFARHMIASQWSNTHRVPKVSGFVRLNLAKGHVALVNLVSPSRTPWNQSQLFCAEVVMNGTKNSPTKEQKTHTHIHTKRYKSFPSQCAHPFKYRLQRLMRIELIFRFRRRHDTRSQWRLPSKYNRVVFFFLSRPSRGLF